MTAFRGVLVDFYGTLVHEDDAVIPPICEAICQQAPEEVTVKEVARFWSAAFFPLCHHSHGDTFLTQREAGIWALRRTIEHFRSAADPVELIARQFAHWVAPPIFPDTLPFLDALAQAKLPVCVVSNIDRPDLEQAMAFHGLQFAYVVTSDDVRAYKPRPEMFLRALQELDLAPHEVLHVGDSRRSDIAGALNTGVPVVWLNRAGKTGSGEPVPTHTADTLVNVADILALPAPKA